MYENNYDPIKNSKGKKTCGFICVTSIYPYERINNIRMFIPYSDLPKRYHGVLFINIIVYDGFDNIVAVNKNTYFNYSTL